MSKTLNYVFDPLCGWCYGASNVVDALAAVPDVQLRLLPSGLFSDGGARPMDAQFAAYAWSNDQRIKQLTGQRFSERYRTEVLARHPQMFDSGPATMALTAVALYAPERELDALKAIQHARYVEGQDVVSLQTLATVLRALSLDQAAERLEHPAEDLLAANRVRIAEAQALLRQSDARGVPTFILDSKDKRQLLHTSTVFSDPQSLVEQLAEA